MGSKAIFKSAADMPEKLAATRKVLLQRTEDPTSESDRLVGRGTLCSAHENGSLNKLTVAADIRATDKDPTKTRERVRREGKVRPEVIQWQSQHEVSRNHTRRHTASAS